MSGHLPPTRLSGQLFLSGVPLRRSGHRTRGGGLERRTVQHDEVGDLPRKGWLLASLGIALVSVFTRLRGRSSLSLSPIPRDDNGKPSRLLRQPLETLQRFAANDDTDRFS